MSTSDSLGGAASTLGSILGNAASNDSAQQLFIWGVLYGLLSAVFQPITTEITQEMWEGAIEANLHRALPADLLATMVVRGWITQGAGQAEAAKSGIAQNDFDNMVNNARNPISPEEAAVALRRNIIPHDAAPGLPSFINAIQEGNLGDQWAPIIQQLATAIPTPADVLQGVLQGQIPEGTDPVALYTQVGGQAVDPNTGFDWYTFMFNTRGAAPTPNEAATMALRQIIPWGDGSDGPVVQGPGAVSFYQAFLEGPWRNKWEPAWRELSKYFPPPRTIVTLLREGVITSAQATTYLEQQGLTPDLAAAYIAAAHSTKATSAKNLNEGTITQLLLDKIITVDQATTYFEQLGYSSSEAGLLATSAQARQTASTLTKNVNKIGTYYIAHKINKATANTELAALGIDPAQIGVLLAGWDIDRSANVAHLTAAQITSAWEYLILTEAEAMQELQVLGYTPYDAWTLLSIKAKQPLPNPPPFGPALTP